MKDYLATKVTEWRRSLLRLALLATATMLSACGGGDVTVSREIAKASVTAAVPQTGIWWNSAEAGRGYAIERQGSMVALGAYMYEASGVATWYLGILALQSDGSYAGALTRYSGGQTLLGTYKAPAASNVVANITLTASTPTTASLLVQPTDGGQPVTTQIERFSFNSTPSVAPTFESGIWWSEWESGRGYFIDVQGSRAAIASYMYDDSGQPVWYLSVGDVQAGPLIQAQMEQYSGGQTLTGTYKAAASKGNVGQVDFHAVTSTTGYLVLANKLVVPLKRFALAPATPPSQRYLVTTLAGSGAIGSTDGTASDASFQHPFGVAVDGIGNAYVADTNNHLIRKISPSGVVTTLAGLDGMPGSKNGTGSDALFRFPNGVAVDAVGNLYVADTNNHLIRKISPSGVVTTLAGLDGVPGSRNGTGSAALFYEPTAVAVDQSGTIYVADTGNGLIRKISPSGVVTTLAGGALGSTRQDGAGTAASFYNPTGIAVDASGYVYVADAGNRLIRKISPSGAVTTLAGGGDIMNGALDGTGSAASFTRTQGIAVDSSGYIYVTDTGWSSIRGISQAGVVTTLAGSGPYSSFSPMGIALDMNGNIYVTDERNNMVRKLVLQP